MLPADERTWLTALEASARAGRWTEVRSMAAEAGSVPPDAALLVAEAELRQGDFAEARDRLDRLVPTLESQARPGILARAVNLRGAAHLELGALARAEEQFDRALDLAARNEDHLTVARATNNLGIIANHRGLHQAALALYRLAIPAYQQLGFPRGLGETHHNLAIALRDLGQADEADRQERRAIAFAEESGSGRLLAMARAGRAELSLLRHEPEVAAGGARLAAEEYARLRDPVGEADALRLLGLADTMLGRLDEAEAAIERALALANGRGSLLVEAETLRARAGLRLVRNEVTEARHDADAARGILERIGAVAEREALDQWWSSAQ